MIERARSTGVAFEALVVGALALFGGLTGGTGAFASPLAAQEVGIALGAVPGPAEVQDLDETPLQFTDLIEEGKPTLIEFWATWCEVCEAIQPELDAIQAAHGEEINIIAVAVGVAQSLRRVNRHLEDHNPGYRYVWDFNGAAVRSFEAPVTASIVILDADGKVAYTGVGVGQDLMGKVQAVLGGSGPGTPGR